MSFQLEFYKPKVHVVKRILDTDELLRFQLMYRRNLKHTYRTDI